MWGHMIQLKTHDSREFPPDKPFFRQLLGSKNTSASATGRVHPGVSPGKRINLHTECLSQLSAITEGVHKETKETILKENNENFVTASYKAVVFLRT